MKRQSLLQQYAAIAIFAVAFLRSASPFAIPTTS
jgi:hypothetical protein